MTSAMPTPRVPTSELTAIRGQAVTFRGDPFVIGDEAAFHYRSDALILMQSGHIVGCGDYDTLIGEIPAGTAITHYRECVILPGFIDCHVHYPQTQIIGAYGKQLLDWLEHYTFVAEQQFADPAHASAVAKVFLQECLRAGTTTAMVYGTVHPQSVDAFFLEAQARSMRMIAGKVLMDRNAPPALCDSSVDAGYAQSQALIRRWHHKGRLAYAVTPRFAPTSSPAQLETCGALLREFPGVYLQTHLSENAKEIQWVRELYPERSGYLDVYDHYGCLGRRSVLGHALHLSDGEWQRLRETNTAIAHCPSSNAFLGSGLFSWPKAKAALRPLRVGLATDIGAGTSFSQLQTMHAAYQIGQLGGYPLSAVRAFYLATRGAAEALDLGTTIGSLEIGMEADVMVLDLQATPLLAYRMTTCTSIQEALFLQMILGDDRSTRAVYVNGSLAYARPEPTR